MSAFGFLRWRLQQLFKTILFPPFSFILEVRKERNEQCKPQSTYVCSVEYRAVSGVFQNIDPPPPPPFHTASVSSPRTKSGGYTLAGRAVSGWGVNILEDARQWVGLLQYDFSTVQAIPLFVKKQNPPEYKTVYFNYEILSRMKNVNFKIF